MHVRSGLTLHVHVGAPGSSFRAFSEFSNEPKTYKNRPAGPDCLYLPMTPCPRASGTPDDLRPLSKVSDVYDFLYGVRSSWNAQHPSLAYLNATHSLMPPDDSNSPVRTSYSLYYAPQHFVLFFYDSGNLHPSSQYRCIPFAVWSSFL